MSEPAAVGAGADLELDTRGLLCPLPVIRLQQAAALHPPGTLINVIATDPGVKQDIPAWCRVHGHELLGVVDAADHEYRLRVRLAAPGET